MNPLLLSLLLLSLAGCAIDTTDTPRDRFIRSLDAVDDRTLWIPPTVSPLAAPSINQEWLLYQTPYGPVTNLGDGWMMDQQGRLYVPY